MKMIKSKLFKNWDWSKFDVNNIEHRKKLTMQLKYFLAIPDLEANPQFAQIAEFQEDRKKHQEMVQKIQEFTAASDFPASILPVIQKYDQLTYYDNGYESVFDVRDMSGLRRNGFDLLDIANNVQFLRTPLGRKAKLYQMSGEKAHVYFERYAGGLNWDRTLFDDEEYLTIESLTKAYRNAAFQTRAAVFYALIDALPIAQNIALQPSPDTLVAGTRGQLASQDAATMNLAAQQIILNVLNRGYGVTPQNTTFIVLCPLQLRGRIKQALNFTYDTAATTKSIDYKFQQITTTMLAAANVYYVILPKNKLIAGYRMDLTTFTDFDILSYTDAQVGWMRYGGALGDVQQLQRCAIV
ncbi:MAG: hypothetical protein KAV87_55385 [Desulfobacteraceae bacterium]|nr:hypothetical protein [Desulfobacteraceae bacterium]